MCEKGASHLAFMLVAASFPPPPGPFLTLLHRLKASCFVFHVRQVLDKPLSHPLLPFFPAPRPAFQRTSKRKMRVEMDVDGEPILELTHRLTHRGGSFFSDRRWGWLEGGRWEGMGKRRVFRRLAR